MSEKKTKKDTTRKVGYVDDPCPPPDPFGGEDDHVDESQDDSDDSIDADSNGNGEGYDSSDLIARIKAKVEAMKRGRI